MRATRRLTVDRRRGRCAPHARGLFRLVASLTAAALGAVALGCGVDGASAPVPSPPAGATASAARPAPADAASAGATTGPQGWVLPEEPARTRAGQLRFVDPALDDNPAAATLILERLATEPRAPVRAALVEALPRTGGEWLAEIVVRFGAEPAAAVRLAMASIAPRAPRGEGASLLALALADLDPAVRTEAALATASLGAPDAVRAALPDRLVRLLADPEARPRAAAARSLGILGVGPSFAAIRPLLGDADDEVRLQALRALERLAPERAARLAEVESLEHDRDARVARLATKLRSSAGR